MSSRTRSYSIRLSAEGKRQVEADLKALGNSGERSLRLIQNATRPATAGLQATDRAARDLRGGLQAVSGEIPAVQRLTRLLGTTALAGGLVALGRSSLDVGRQFQAAMKRVEAATGAAEGTLSRLADAARQTGATTAFTAQQAADAIEVLAKNGVNAEAILGGALKATVNLAGALGAELAPAGDLVTDVMQQFNLAASDMPAVADAITGAALTSKFGFDDLRLAIGQAGGVAGKFGGDYQEFLSVLSATSSSFASGSDAGTSFKNFLQRLTPQSKQAAEAMSDLGLEFYTADGTMKSMVEIAGELQDAVSGLSAEARNSSFQTIFGTDAIRTALALADQGAEGLRDLAAAQREVSAEDQAQVRLEGLDGALKELTAAWEALQLTTSENGGLDVAEDAVDRLTSALRYLEENFTEVEEVAERVAQALIVFLVGRGITYATAKAVAMRAAYIELAGAVTGVGTAASRSVGALTRMGAAARVLMGTMGGPLGLAVTAASLASLAIDFDSTSDAIGRADVAAEEGARALDQYREASRRAADEQARLGGEVSEATRQMLAQSRAQLQQALDDAQRAYNEARGAMSGRVFDRSGLDDFERRIRSLFQINLQTGKPAEGTFQNRFLSQIADAASELEDGRISVKAFLDEFDRIRAVGDNLQEVGDQISDILQSGTRLADSDTLVSLRRAAEEAGLFGEELEAIAAADNPGALAVAYMDLVSAIRAAGQAGEYLRAEGLAGFRENITSLAEAEGKVDDLSEALEGNLDLTQEISGERPFDEAADSAEKATASIKQLSAAQEEYVRTRSAAIAPPESAEDLLKKLDGQADPIEASALALKYFEGFQPTGKMDVNAYRAGYGSDTVTLSNGSEVAITKGMRVSVEDATRDLYRRIGEFQAVVAGQIGQERFGSFTAPQQAALTSIAYNYGELPGRILAAVRSGSNADISSSILGLAGDNDGINRGRRNTEAAVFSRSLGVEAASEASIEARKKAEEERAKAAEEASEERVRTQKEEAETLKRLVEVGDEQIAQLQLEAELTGKSAGEQARLRFMFERLAEAKRAGIDPDRQLASDGRVLIDVWREQADVLARRTTAQDRVATKTQEDLDRLSESKDAVRSAFDELKPGGEGVMGFFDQLTGFVADKLWELALDPVWDALAELMDGLVQNLAAAFGGAAPAPAPAAPAAAGNADGGPIGGYKGGGGLQVGGRAAGHLRGSGGKRQDNILFWGSRGEFMQPAAAVDYYGTDFMEAVRQRRFPKRADGGSLDAMAPMAPSAAPQGGASGLQVHVHEGAGGDETRVEGNPGAGRVDIYTRSMMKDALRSGGLDGAMRERYGVSPKARGR